MVLRLFVLAFLFALLPGIRQDAPVSAAPAPQQPVAPRRATPSLEEQEAQLEQIFAAAVAASGSEAEPLHQLQAWGAVMMSAVALDARRAQELGVEREPQRARESLLARWRELRPDSAGPDLFRLLEIQDQEARLPGLLELLAHYPDDSLLLWQTGQTLRSFGRSQEASDLLEEHARRSPSKGSAWRLLVQHYESVGNETLQAQALRSWAEAAPDDPVLLSRWLSAGLDRAEPEATARLIQRFVSGRPEGQEALQVCGLLAKARGGAYRKEGRACIARLAAGDGDDKRVAQRAARQLAELTAAAADWDGLLESLEALDPARRSRALVGAARSLASPARCSERLELLRSAADFAGSDEQTYSSIASATRACRERPAAQGLFLDLLRTAPTDQVFRVVSGWALKVNGVWRGDLPAATASVLESRLAEDPQAVELYRALDVVYQLGGDFEHHFALLQRWLETAPESIRSQQLESLAEELTARGESDRAIVLLEDRRRRAFSSSEAELLWQLYLLPAALADDSEPGIAAWEDALGRAERFAGELIAGGEPNRAAFGHLLAARSSLLRENVGKAEAHYRQALGTSESPREAWAIEMLEALAMHAEDERLARLAIEICEMGLERQYRGSTLCATTVLSKSGNGEAVTHVAEVAGTLPEDPRALEALAFAAQSSDAELAERAWRRLIEIDPRDLKGWVNLAVFLEKQDRLQAVEELLLDARQSLSQLPVDLLRSVGRIRTAQGRVEEALAIFREARAAMPEGSDPAWVDAEMRAAYAKLGRQAAEQTAADPKATSSRPLGSEEAAALDAELAPAGPRAVLTMAEALRSGSGGRYDPEAAKAIIARAGAEGDPLATYRLALIRRSKGPLPREVLAAVTSLAQQGDSYAQYLVGTGALLGVGSERDPALARHWLELASAQGEVWAIHNLATLHESGEGFERADRQAALDGYRRAGDLGNVWSLYDVARFSLTVYGSGPSCADGLERLERSATAGFAPAITFLGKVLFYGRGRCVEPDPARSLPWLERGAESGNHGAKYDLGLALLLDGEPATAEHGLALVREVAEIPDALAIETLLFARGTGAFVPRDPVRAGELLIDAAKLGSDGLLLLRREAGFPPFQRLLSAGIARLEELVAEGDSEAGALLAAMLLSGPTQRRDPERGVLLARAAAEDGDAWAMRLLGEALFEGTGVAASTSQGLHWLRLAAEAGDGSAMFRLASELMSGERLDPDLEAGLEWLTSAGEQGHWLAIGELARTYAEGRPGIAPDPERAARWKRRRAELGDREARGWLIAHGHDAP